VPPPGNVQAKATEGFLAELRRHTPWRLKVGEAELSLAIAWQQQSWNSTRFLSRPGWRLQEEDLVVFVHKSF
jgi:hypothetical protein